MLARIFVRLQYAITVPKDDSFTPIIWSEDGLTVTVYQPQQFSHMEGLFPCLALPPAASKKTIYNDLPTVEADILVVEVKGEDLDRSPGNEHGPNPTLALAIKAVNRILDNLRRLTQNPDVRPADGPSFIAFMTDKGEILESSPPDIRMALRPKVPLIFRNTVVDSEIWDNLGRASQSASPHRNLMLDAHAIYPEPTCLTLAFTAVEATVKLVIRTLAASVSPPSVGEWLVSNRFREPRVADMIKGVVWALSGVRLDQEPSFWKPLQRLIEARNSIVHDGSATSNGQPLSKTDLHQLLTDSDRLVIRLEELASIAPPETITRDGSVEFSCAVSDWNAPLSIKLKKQIDD